MAFLTILFACSAISNNELVLIFGIKVFNELACFFDLMLMK